jgi:hypothetical protein
LPGQGVEDVRSKRVEGGQVSPEDPGWYESLPRWVRQTIDQTLHVAIGAIAASVLWIGHPILAGVLAALWVAAVREREQWPPKRVWDLVLDVCCTLLGGLLMGIVIWAVS